MNYAQSNLSTRILAMNTNSTASVEGIEIIRLIDFLTEQVLSYMHMPADAAKQWIAMDTERYLKGVGIVYHHRKTPED